MEKAGTIQLQAGGTNDLTIAAAGNPITACGASVQLNVTLLQLLIKLANGLQAQSPNLKLVIHNFASPPWHGCDTGRHPKGRASDVHVAGVPGDPEPGHLDTRADYQQPENLKFAQDVMDSLPPGGGLGQKEYIGALQNTAGKRYFEDGPNHFHIDVGDTAP
jgi:hypothetical protein